jgi:hypothetical protein
VDYVMLHSHRPSYALSMPLSWLPDPRKSERAACLVTHMVLIGKYEVGRAELNASAGGWWLARCAHVTKYYGYFPSSLHRRSRPPTSNPKSKNPITRCELSMRASCSPCARCWDCFQTTAVLSILSFLPGQASIPQTSQFYHVLRVRTAHYHNVTVFENTCLPMLLKRVDGVIWGLSEYIRFF